MQPESAPAQWSKLDRIRYLLDQWDAIFDPSATSPFGIPGDGSGVALLSLMSRHHSVVELERCLKLLFIVAPGDYRHLKTFRVGCEWRIQEVHQRRRRPNGKFEIVPVRQRARIMPAWIDKRRVERGELFLEAKFRGDVDIPRELWDALNTPAVAA